MSTVSVCLCTYRRPQQLGWLLDDLLAQTRRPDQVVVVDNDASGSARQTVEDWQARARPPFEVLYAIEPRKNIPHARNRTVSLATGDWMIFPDDDERALPGWIANMLAAVAKAGADGALGPVLRIPPPDAPDWIVRSGVLERVRCRDGQSVRHQAIGFGNVLVASRFLRDPCQYNAQGEGPFDPAFGLTGVDDLDLLARLDAAGAKMIWCDAPDLSEPIEPARMTMDYIRRRAERNGRDYALMRLNGRYGEIGSVGRAVFALRAGVQGAIALTLSLLLRPLARHLWLRWHAIALANYGKLTALWGRQVQEYA